MLFTVWRKGLCMFSVTKTKTKNAYRCKTKSYFSPTTCVKYRSESYYLWIAFDLKSASLYDVHFAFLTPQSRWMLAKNSFSRSTTCVFSFSASGKGCDQVHLARCEWNWLGCNYADNEGSISVFTLSAMPCYSIVRFYFFSVGEVLCWKLWFSLT